MWIRVWTLKLGFLGSNFNFFQLSLIILVAFCYINVLRHIFGMLSPKPMPISRGSSFFSNMSMSKLRRIMGLQGLKRRENPNLKFTITCEFIIHIQYGVKNWWSNVKATKLPQHIWCVEIKTFRMVFNLTNCQPVWCTGKLLNRGQSLITKLVVTLGYKLNIFLLEVNFDKFTIKLHLLLISSMLAKFQEN